MNAALQQQGQAADPLLASGRRFILWDTSAVLGYYIPEAATNARAEKRARIIINSVRHHRTDGHFYIPNIVVAEVFSEMARQCYSTWDGSVTKKYGGSTLDTRRYKSARKRFRNDIHNGGLFYQYELNRYHILGLDLLAPLDKYRKYYRTRNVRSMGASDLLIGAMALHLVRIHGRDSVAVLTCDRRMDAIFARTCGSLAKSTRKYLALDEAAVQFGFGKWCPELYPQVIDVARCPRSALIDFFGTWPLVTRKVRNKPPKA